MARKFTLEVEVVVEDKTATTTLEVARKHYVRRGGVKAYGGRRRNRPVPPENFVSCIEEGLIELLEQNPLLEEAGVEIRRVSCSTPATLPAPLCATSEERDETIELDETGSGLYLCRWPNGDFSIVKADNKREAIVALDEWAGAEPAWLVPMDDCMIDFTLNNSGEIEFVEFGEETADFVWDNCYPELDLVLSGENLRRCSGKQNLQATKQIRKAVQHERKRLWAAQDAGTPAKTMIGRELQMRLRTVGPVADHYLGEFGTRILRGETGTKGKPN
jgi:hypothetical protein